MRALSASVVAVLLTGLASGCASTQLTVRKVSAEGKEPNGIRYSLPKPFLLITPGTSGDGSLKVEVIYLPDTSNTYAIDGRTKRGKYELTVNVKDGLLSKVAWSQKDAALVAEGVRVAGEIAKGELERQNDEAREREQAAADERKAADAEIKKLESDLDERQLELQLAVIELESAQAAVDQGDQSAAARTALRKAQLARDQARAARDFAEEQLRKARARLEAMPSGFDDSAAKADATRRSALTPNQSLFWSPVLYEIVDDGKTVRLKAVEWRTGLPGATAQKQIELRTTAVPKTAAPPRPSPRMLNPSTRARVWRQGPLAFTLELDQPVDALVDAGRRLFRINADGSREEMPALFSATLLPDGRQVLIQFPSPPLAAGEYSIEAPFIYGERTGTLAAGLTIQR
jgi:hypothetical protein